MDRLGLTCALLCAAFAIAVGVQGASAAEIVAARESSPGRIVILDGGDRDVLTRERYPFGPVWSPQHRRVAFAATLKAGFEYVVLVARSGRHERRVTGFGWSFPSWTPDGRLTVACLQMGACEERSGLYVLDPSRPERIRRLRGTSGASASSWGPGGDRVVFVGESRGRGDLFLKRPGRPGLRRLTSSDVDEAAPDWSPNGRWIVYSRPPRNPAQPHDLWLVSPDGRHRRRLTRTRRNETNPAWSASGRRIVFSTPRGLFSIRRDGSYPRRVRGSMRGDCCPDW